jgi:hypothetical protein
VERTDAERSGDTVSSVNRSDLWKAIYETITEEPTIPRRPQRAEKLAGARMGAGA